MFRYKAHSFESEFKVPYGNLIFIQPLESATGKAEFSFSNVVKAAMHKEGAWVTSPSEENAKIAYGWYWSFGSHCTS